MYVENEENNIQECLTLSGLCGGYLVLTSVVSSNFSVTNFLELNLIVLCMNSVMGFHWSYKLWYNPFA